MEFFTSLVRNCENVTALKLTLTVLTVPETNFTPSPKTKFLGLIFDENLSWDEHVDHVISKINSGIYLKKLYHLRTFKKKKKYDSRPHSCFWGIIEL